MYVILSNQVENDTQETKCIDVWLLRKTYSTKKKPTETKRNATQKKNKITSVRVLVPQNFFFLSSSIPAKVYHVSLFISIIFCPKGAKNVKDKKDVPKDS